MSKVVLTLIALLMVMAACSTPESAPTLPPATELPDPTVAPTAAPALAFPLTVTDGVGEQVTIESKPERIISLAPSHTETLYALGLGERVVGVTEFCNYPPEAAEKATVGGFSGIDLEQVVGLDPDLVLATTMHMGDVVPALEEHGITVFVVAPMTILDVLEATGAIGQITGREKEAEALLADLQERIDAVQDAVQDAPRPTVFWELGPELYTVGPGSFVSDLIAMAGGENVADDADSPWPQLSVEVIILKDPDVLVLADHNYGETAEMVKERPGWQEISAVRDGRVVEITDDDIVSRPGPRIVDGLEFLARALHPDLFE